MIRVVGERLTNNGSRELIYSFNIEPKSTISPELFAYCVEDFWSNSVHKGSESLGFPVVSTGEGSPGQIFKLPEASVRSLLDGLDIATDGALAFEESRSMQQIWRKKPINQDDLLDAVYPI